MTQEVEQICDKLASLYIKSPLGQLVDESSIWSINKKKENGKMASKNGFQLNQMIQ